MCGPRVFIGSSSEGRHVAAAIQAGLDDVADPVHWSQGIFQLSRTTFDSLLQQLDKFDFAVLILTPSDTLNLRGQELAVPRDNVILELGLFLGRLGPERTFFVIPSNAENFHLPTDLLGTTAATYKTDRSDNDLDAAVGPTCYRISSRIKALGCLSRPSLAGSKPEFVRDESLSELVLSSRHAHVNLEDSSLAKRNPSSEKTLRVNINLHVIGPTTNPLVIPRLGCHLAVEVPRVMQRTDLTVKRWVSSRDDNHPTVALTSDEVVIKGSGVFILDGKSIKVSDALAVRLCEFRGPALIHVQIKPVGFSTPASHTFEIPFETNSRPNLQTIIAKWHLNEY